MKSLTWNIVVIALLALSTACSPQAEDLVGVWVVTGDATDLGILPGLGEHTRLELFESGRFVVTSYPWPQRIESSASAEYEVFFIDGEGEWSLTRSGTKRLKLRFRSGGGDGIDLAKTGTTLFPQRFLGPLQLRAYVGDPDLLEMVTFEKQ